MFGNSKEYHDIQKLYLEKVSKTEDIQEFKSKFSKPQQPVKSPMEAGMGPGAAKARAMAKARIAAKKAASQPKPSKPEGAKVDTSSEIESSSAEFKANEGDKFNKNFNKQNAKPTFQKNRDKLNQSRQNQNKDRLKNQLGGVKKTVGKVGGAIKSFADRFKARPIERKEGQTSVRSKSGGVKTGAGTDTQGTKKPAPNTGTDTQGTRKEIPQRNTGTDTQGTRKQIPQRNTGTDTETKTNTQIKKFPGSGKEIDPRAKVTQTTSTNDKGQKVTTTKTNLNLTGKEASDKKKEYLKKKAERRNNLNSMKEDYTPYDIVLEYLLSTEQAATIEEANYIMTEMDAKTIQDIVSQQLNEQN